VSASPGYVGEVKAETTSRIWEEKEGEGSRRRVLKPTALLAIGD